MLPCSLLIPHGSGWEDVCPSGKVAALPGRDTSGSDAVRGKEAASKDLFNTWDENDFLRSDRQTLIGLHFRYFVCCS